MKKILTRISEILCILIIIASIAVLLNVVFTKPGEQPNIMGYYTFRILTGSMEPEIPTDSFVIVKKTPAQELQKGDVISFYSRDPKLGGAVNTHRVNEVTLNENGVYVFKTKGDANIIEDTYEVYQSDIIGKVIYVSHGLGVAVRLLSNPIGFAAVIIIPLAAIFISNIVGLVKTAKAVETAELEGEKEEKTDEK